MAPTVKYQDATTQTSQGANGVSYAYRRLGPASARPLVLLQHFRGNLENWDPHLIDALSSSRDVVVFDNTGVGATTGSTPTTIGQMADDAIVFLDALGLNEVDLLGFSIGSFIAQDIALTRSALVSKLILASTAPQGAPGMHGWAPDIIKAIGSPKTDAEGLLHGFFTDSDASRTAGAEFLQRIFSRTKDRDQETSWQTRNAQYDAVLKWGPQLWRAAEAQRDQAAGVHHKRRQRSDDPALVLASRCEPYSGRVGQVLPRCRARLPFPARGRVRRGCQQVSPVLATRVIESPSSGPFRCIHNPDRSDRNRRGSLTRPPRAVGTPPVRPRRPPGSRATAGSPRCGSSACSP